MPMQETKKKTGDDLRIFPTIRERTGSPDDEGHKKMDCIEVRCEMEPL